MREFLLQVPTALSEPLHVVLMALAMWLAVRIRKSVHNQDIAQLLITFDQHIADGVASVYQDTVKAAKDAGAWNQDVAKVAKASAVARIQATAADTIEKLRSMGVNVQSIMDSKIESKVVDLNARVGKGGA